ncbi:MAG: hypothetical protein ACLQFR_25885 [Streptosporangiaceae bacterium]
MQQSPIGVEGTRFSRRAISTIRSEITWVLPVQALPDPLETANLHGSVDRLRRVSPSP